ncbi:MSHA biogenesis protein MshP [Vibrio navarrensis]
MTHLSTTRRSQRGSGLVLVIFIIVVVGFVAAVANRNQQRNSQQLVSMVLGTRAEMAARSAAEIEISQFYQSTTQGSCHLNAAQSYSFSGDGLTNCEAEVSCAEIGAMDDGRNVFQLTATGRCQAGGWMLQRVVEVGVRDDDA